MKGILDKYIKDKHNFISDMKKKHKEIIRIDADKFSCGCSVEINEYYDCLLHTLMDEYNVKFVMPVK